MLPWNTRSLTAFSPFRSPECWLPIVWDPFFGAARNVPPFTAFVSETNAPFT